MASGLLRRKVLGVGSLKRSWLQPRRHGYIVLVPEVPGDLPDKHSMSRADEGFPAFTDINGEQCISALGKITLEYETGFWKLEDKLKAAEGPIAFDDVIAPLEDLALPLDAAWGVLKTLSLVESSRISPESYTTVHERARRARAKRFHSPSIYQAMKSLSGNKQLTEEQERTVRKFLLEGKLNGLDLSAADQQNFYEILGQISQERAKFRGKLEVATAAFKQIIGDASLVRDFPPALLQVTAKDRTRFAQGPWTFSLNPTVANQFMQYCPMRELRWNLWQASNRRCSNDGEKALNTSTHIESLRSLRADQSKLLGFESFAHMSMQTKMAGSIETVQSMIATLLLKAHPAQAAEIASLKKFAEERGFEGDIQPWDVPYWKRKQQRTLFEMTEDEMRPYFPLSRVLEGLFLLAEKLFQVEVLQDMHASTWHPDVSLYHVRNTEGRLLGAFYLDPYSRPESKLASGAGWMLGLRSRNMAAFDGGLPLAALVFNFQSPSSGDSPVPCCLSLVDMQQLFLKFGHMMQHVLATAQCSEVAGLTNVEWDAVNISSELMAMWLQHNGTLQSLSGHYETGEPLPDAQVNALAEVQKHLAGHELCKQLYLSSLDLELHTTGDFWLEVVRRLHPQYSPFQLDKRDAHPCSFAPIFSGDWAAAYYSTLWGRMVAADAFSAFLENPNDIEAIGLRFRQTMLEQGGACQPAVAFRRFRGRDPSPNALLRSLGLKPYKPPPPQSNTTNK